MHTNPVKLDSHFSKAPRQTKMHYQTQCNDFDDDLTVGTLSCGSSTGSVSTITFSVAFDSVQVREFDRIPGDHPNVSEGVPLTFGWKYNQNKDVSLDDYERLRQKHRRSKENLRLSSTMRKFILLHNFNIPQHEILTAEKEVLSYQEAIISNETRKTGYKKVPSFFRIGQSSIGQKLVAVSQKGKSSIMQTYSKM